MADQLGESQMAQRQSGTSQAEQKAFEDKAGNPDFMAARLVEECLADPDGAHNLTDKIRGEFETSASAHISDRKTYIEGLAKDLLAAGPEPLAKYIEENIPELLPKKETASVDAKNLSVYEYLMGHKPGEKVKTGELDEHIEKYLCDKSQANDNGIIEEAFLDAVTAIAPDLSKPGAYLSKRRAELLHSWSYSELAINNPANKAAFEKIGVIPGPNQTVYDSRNLWQTKFLKPEEPHIDPAKLKSDIVSKHELCQEDAKKLAEIDKQESPTYDRSTYDAAKNKAWQDILKARVDLKMAVDAQQAARADGNKKPHTAEDEAAKAAQAKLDKAVEAKKSIEDDAAQSQQAQAKFLAARGIISQHMLKLNDQLQSELFIYFHMPEYQAMRAKKDEMDTKTITRKDLESLTK